MVGEGLWFFWDKKLMIFDHICSYMIKSGHIWPDLIVLCHVRVRYQRPTGAGSGAYFAYIWSDVCKSEQICTYLVRSPFEIICSNVLRSEQIWTDMSRYAQIWPDLPTDSLFSKYADLVTSDQILLDMARSGHICLYLRYDTFCTPVISQRVRYAQIWLDLARSGKICSYLFTFHHIYFDFGLERT